MTEQKEECMTAKILGRRQRAYRLLVWLLVAMSVLVPLTPAVLAQGTAKTTSSKTVAQAAVVPGINQDVIAAVKPKFIVIDRVKIDKKRISLSAPKPEIRFTVILNRVSAAAVPFTVELYAIEKDNTLGALKKSVNLSVPANERAERVKIEIPTGTSAGRYVLRVSQPDRNYITSHVKVLNLVAEALPDAPQFIRAVVYTPVTDIAIENPAAEEEEDTVSEGEGSGGGSDDDLLLAALRAAAAKQQIPRFKPKQPFFLTAITGKETEVATAKDYEVRITMEQIDGTGERIFSGTRQLRGEQQYHTYSFYATKSLDKEGSELKEGTYRITVVRLKVDDKDEYMPQSVLFKVTK